MSVVDGVMARAVRLELLAWRGARVQQVRDPGERCIVLELFLPESGPAHLLLDASPPARVHLVRRPPANPPEPSALCRLFRARLVGTRLADASMDGLERVLVLTFARGSREAPAERWHLHAELLGRRGNVVIVGDDGRVVDALRRERPKVEGEDRLEDRGGAGRAIWPGQPYAWPPRPSETRDPLLEEPESLRRRIEDLLAAGDGGERPPLDRALAAVLPGVGRDVVREWIASAALDPSAPPPSPDADPQAAARLAEAVDRGLSGIRADRFAPCRIVETSTRRTLRFAALPLTPGPGEELEPFASPSGLLEAVLSEEAPRTGREERLRRLRRRVAEELARASRRLDRQRREWAEAEDARRWRHLGELLMASLHLVKPGASSVQVPDWEDGGRPRTIELDPRLSPAENAQALFARYRKARRRQDELRPWLARSEEEARRLLAWSEWLAAADPGDPAAEARIAEIEEALRSGAAPRGPGKGKRTVARRSAPASGRGARWKGAAGGGPSSGGEPRRYLSDDGWTLLVGRNSRQNDRLALREARPDDWWFHAKEVPGTHVVARAPEGWPPGEPPPPRTLAQAALLAAFFSRARQGSNVAVDFTRCRHVRRIRGAGPGQVAYDHHRTTFATPSEELPPRRVDSRLSRPLPPPDTREG